MRLKSIPTLVVSTLVLTLLSGCGGRSGVRITEGSEQIGSAPTGSVFATNAATLVHVDVFERLATLRNARGFAAGTFLETRDGEGNQTGILKARENRESGLRTADILEGAPRINNRAVPVSAAERARLKKKYRDPVEV
ncbi:MAG: hypothetical protein ACI9ZV_000242 [Candidatus Azotimanducaceae bacterium]|jgi:hypothetical protein